MWGYNKNSAVWNSKEGSSQNLTMLVPWSQIFSLENCELWISIIYKLLSLWHCVISTILLRQAHRPIISKFGASASKDSWRCFKIKIFVGSENFKKIHFSYPQLVLFAKTDLPVVKELMYLSHFPFSQWKVPLYYKRKDCVSSTPTFIKKCLKLLLPSYHKLLIRLLSFTFSSFFCFR